MSELSVNKSKFVTEYLKHGIGSKAVIAAGMSPNGASVTANRFLKDPKIVAELARRRAHLEKRSELSAQKVMDTLVSLIDANIQDLHGPDGELLPVNEWPRDLAAAVSQIDGKKVRMSSKLQALELAARVLNMVKQQSDQFVPVQIIIGPPPELPPAATPAAMLKPEW